MFQIELAGHSFAVENAYSYVEKLCQDYRTTKQPEAVIRVSAAEIARENEDGGNWSPAYLESLAVYRKICERLLEDNIVLFHCSAIEVDGKAYLFTAPSGTGKSTHTRLWREVLKDRVKVINDDKPLLSIPIGDGAEMPEEIRVYGTPYGGKDGLQSNISAPVAAIVILHQAKENTIKRMDAASAYPMLLNQTYRRKDAQGMLRTLDLVERLAGLPVYSLGCTISEEAVKLAYHTMIEG